MIPRISCDFGSYVCRERAYTARRPALVNRLFNLSSVIVMKLGLRVKLTIGAILVMLIISWYRYGVKKIRYSGTPANSKPAITMAIRDKVKKAKVEAAEANLQKRKIILFTTRPYTNTAKFLGTAEAQKKCPRCIFTHDHSKWNQSDVVLFNGLFLEEKPRQPKVPGQIWIYYNRETPDRMSRNEHEFHENYRHLFNWTMTFRRDSDVLMPYTYLTAKPSKNKKAALSKFRKKKKMAAWIVSNCKTPSKREKLVEKLAKHIDIDIYGKCGFKNCSTTRSQSIGSDCRRELANNYKFYLSFENSLCEDYVSEKFFDLLELDMVPIVYNGANLSALGIPKGSYVNVGDFDSVLKLASHITWLNDHPNEYVKYLESRQGVVSWLGGYHARVWCSICDKLYSNDTRTESQTYADIREWWNHTIDGRPMCLPPPEFVL